MAIDPEGTKLKWWHWLIAGLAAVASFAFAVATAGIGLAVAGAIAGAATGALYGYGVAVTTGQDVWECIGIGVLAGITLGNIATGFGAVITAENATFAIKVTAYIANALFSASVGVGAETLSQVSAYGKVVDWGNVAWSALQWGVLNTINLALGVQTNTKGFSKLALFGTGLISGYLYNHITGVIGFVIDLIKSGSFNKKRGFAN